MIFTEDILPADLEALTAKFGAAAVANAARTALRTELQKHLTAETKILSDPSDVKLMELAMRWRPQLPKSKAASKIATMISAMTAEQRAEVLESLKKLDGSAA